MPVNLLQKRRRLTGIGRPYISTPFPPNMETMKYIGMCAHMLKFFFWVEIFHMDVVFNGTWEFHMDVVFNGTWEFFNKTSPSFCHWLKYSRGEIPLARTYRVENRNLPVEIFVFFYSMFQDIDLKIGVDDPQILYYDTIKALTQVQSQ